MLAKKYKIKKKTDFKSIFDKGKYFGEGFISLKIIKNDLAVTRFGIIVGSKISKKAVERNKIKRRLENTIGLKQDNLKQGFDIIVMVKPEITQKTYQEIKDNLVSLLVKAGLLIE